MTELSFRTVPKLFGVKEANETRESVATVDMGEEQGAVPAFAVSIVFRLRLCRIDGCQLAVNFLYSSCQDGPLTEQMTYPCPAKTSLPPMCRLTVGAGSLGYLQMY